MPDSTAQSDRESTHKTGCEFFGCTDFIDGACHYKHPVCK
jgi:hypothetical protein